MAEKIQCKTCGYMLDPDVQFCPMCFATTNVGPQPAPQPQPTLGPQPTPGPQPMPGPNPISAPGGNVKIIGLIIGLAAEVLITVGVVVLVLLSKKQLNAKWYADEADWEKKKQEAEDNHETIPMRTQNFTDFINEVAPGDVSGLPMDDLYGNNSEIAAAPAASATGISGAAMLLDVGGGVDGYTEAANYAELLTQLDEALAAGDVTFVGSKIGYTDDATGSILGYPQSVVEHFTSFMAANTDKRESFMNSIQDADRYSGMSGTAYVVNLPLIKYKVTSDYDATSFVFSGFSEQTIDANQTAYISPMLPCMYTFTATNPSWAQPIEGQLEAAMGEPLEVNFGSN